MIKYSFLLFTFCLLQLIASAQFAPQAGVVGSTAISASSAEFVGWAKHCVLKRGWKDIADTTQGYVTLGGEVDAVGVMDHNLVSLGDNGAATVSFNSPLYDGPGADFAVFENGFVNVANPEEAFLELAFVEVSSDGINYTRFPATSNTYDTLQVPGSGVHINARDINNLAGKYVSGFGTPFDLNELSGTPGLDINHITHVRIVDVVGSVGANAQRDKNGHIINDPYPTPFAGGGFDLDAVGAIHMAGWFPVGIENAESTTTFNIYPNPTADKIVLSANSTGLKLTLTDVSGKVLQQWNTSQNNTEISLAQYQQGIYFVLLTDEKGNKWVEKITRL